jgi:hypothetical protein
MKPCEIAAPPEGKEPYSRYHSRVARERMEMKVKDLFPKSYHGAQNSLLSWRYGYSSRKLK